MGEFLPVNTYDADDEIQVERMHTDEFCLLWPHIENTWTICATTVKEMAGLADALNQASSQSSTLDLYSINYNAIGGIHLSYVANLPSIHW